MERFEIVWDSVHRYFFCYVVELSEKHFILPRIQIEDISLWGCINRNIGKIFSNTSIRKHSLMTRLEGPFKC